MLRPRGKRVKTPEESARRNCANVLAGLTPKAGRPEGSNHMRYVLAMIIACALGVPAASALPAASPKSVAASQADQIAQVAKRGARQQQSQRQNRSGAGGSNSGGGNTGGIHPLVGSGDY
jgi:hypothetical protein